MNLHSVYSESLKCHSGHRGLVSHQGKAENGSYVFKYLALLPNKGKVMWEIK